MRWLRERPVVQRMVRDAFALFLAQVLVGALNVWTKLATPIRVLHLAIGAALWVTLVLVAWLGYRLAQRQEVPVRIEERSGQTSGRAGSPTREVAG
jgi:heme A synthase